MNENVSEETKRSIHLYINYLGDVVNRARIAAEEISLFDAARGDQIKRAYARMQLMHRHLEWIHFGIKDEQ